MTRSVLMQLRLRIATVFFIVATILLCPTSQHGVAAQPQLTFYPKLIESCLTSMVTLECHGLDRRSRKSNGGGGGDNDEEDEDDAGDDGDGDKSKDATISWIRILKLKQAEQKGWEAFAEMKDNSSTTGTFSKTSGVTVTGSVGGSPHRSYIRVTWSLASDETFGTYRCDVLTLVTSRGRQDMVISRTQPVTLGSRDLGPGEVMDRVLDLEVELEDDKVWRSGVNERLNTVLERLVQLTNFARGNSRKLKKVLARLNNSAQPQKQHSPSNRTKTSRTRGVKRTYAILSNQGRGRKSTLTRRFQATSPGSSGGTTPSPTEGTSSGTGTVGGLDFGSANTDSGNGTEIKLTSPSVFGSSASRRSGYSSPGGTQSSPVDLASSPSVRSSSLSPSVEGSSPSVFGFGSFMSSSHTSTGGRKPSPSALGSSPSPTKPSPSAFGSSPSPTEPSPSAFGSSPSPTEPSPSALGSSPSPTDPSPSIVGSSPSPTKPFPSIIVSSSSARSSYTSPDGQTVSPSTFESSSANIGSHASTDGTPPSPTVFGSSLFMRSSSLSPSVEGSSAGVFRSSASRRSSFTSTGGPQPSPTVFGSSSSMRGGGFIRSSAGVFRSSPSRRSSFTNTGGPQPSPTVFGSSSSTRGSSFSKSSAGVFRSSPSWRSSYTNTGELQPSPIVFWSSSSMRGSSVSPSAKRVTLGMSGSTPTDKTSSLSRRATEASPTVNPSVVGYTGRSDQNSHSVKADEALKRFFNQHRRTGSGRHSRYRTSRPPQNKRSGRKAFSYSGREAISTFWPYQYHPIHH